MPRTYRTRGQNGWHDSIALSNYGGESSYGSSVSPSARQQARAVRHAQLRRVGACLFLIGICISVPSGWALFKSSSAERGEISLIFYFFFLLGSCAALGTSAVGIFTFCCVATGADEEAGLCAASSKACRTFLSFLGFSPRPRPEEPDSRPPFDEFDLASSAPSTLLPSLPTLSGVWVQQPRMDSLDSMQSSALRLCVGVIESPSELSLMPATPTSSKGGPLPARSLAGNGSEEALDELLQTDSGPGGDSRSDGSAESSPFLRPPLEAAPAGGLPSSPSFVALATVNDGADTAYSSVGSDAKRSGSEPSSSCCEGAVIPVELLRRESAEPLDGRSENEVVYEDAGDASDGLSEGGGCPGDLTTTGTVV